MARKTKDEEAQEFIEGFVMLVKIFTNRRYTKAFVDDIERIGKFAEEMVLALQGKDSVDQILGEVPREAEETPLSEEDFPFTSTNDALSKKGINQ